MSTAVIGSRTHAADSESGLAGRILTSLLAPIRMLAAGWNRFFYTPADPAVLSFIRVLAGGMLFYTHIVWGIDLPALFGSQGWNGPDAVAVVTEGRLAPSFWWYVPDNMLLPVHCLCLSIIFLYWIGFATRITSVLSMAITISYSYRAHMANFGLDQINAILTLYMCIGCSGAALSVDRWLAVRKARRRAEAAGQAFTIPPLKKSITANLAIRLIQLHFCVIYIYAGLSKLQGDAWWSGESVWLAFANLEYQSVDMTWIAWYPWISDIFTHGTIIWEVSFPFAIWVRPLRPYVLFVGFLLHAGIGGMMGLWTFGIIMIFGHVAFWQNEEVRRLLSRIPFRELLLGTMPEVKSLTARITAAAADIVDGVSKVIRPAVLFVSPEARQRSLGFSYFWKRGFPCVAIRGLSEARRARTVVPAGATVFIGTDANDDEITQFHDEHKLTAGDSPLFMVLTEEQSERLNGRIHTHGSYVLTGNVSYGTLRREIEELVLNSDAAGSSNARQVQQAAGTN
ncbi:MAG: hypothetical protein ACK526_10765 [Planctomyces sp.]|jgi:hypothetical protein